MKVYRWHLAIIAVFTVVLAFHFAENQDLYTVTEVYDGDTIKIGDGRIVRLIGVDAPEVESPYRHLEPFGEESKAYLEDLILRKKVRISLGEEPLDKYNRTLAYVYLKDGTLVNGRIIKDGWAKAYQRFDFEYKDLFIAYEKEARSKSIGIWKKE